MPETNIKVGTAKPIVLSASSSSKTRVSNGRGAIVYYKGSGEVSSGNNDGSLAAGESKTFSSPQWLISAPGSTGARLFVEHIPEATTDMATQAELDAAVGDIDESGKGFVAHGADKTVARPSGFASIEWQGSVEPENAIDGDTWIETS